MCNIMCRSQKFYMYILLALASVYIMRFLYLRTDRKVSHLNNKLKIDKNGHLFNYVCDLNTTTFAKHKTTKESEVFRKIDSNDTGIYYVFTAYYDPLLHQVRIIAVAEHARKWELVCHFWFNTNGNLTMSTVSVSLRVVPIAGKTKYNSVILLCPSRQAPNAVSVVKATCQSPTSVLHVTSLPAKPVQNGKFAVCVGPLFGNYDKVDRLVEMIGLNKVFGANYFYFYNYSSSDSVRKILTSLSPHVVTVIPWQIPHKEEIQYLGQLALMNDCLMRASKNFEFAVFTDIDEIIVPHSPYRNWTQMLFLESSKVASFSFRNAFFKLEFAPDSKLQANKTLSRLRAASLVHIQRQKSLYPHTIRSKVIVRPRHVEVIGVHFVWSFKTGYREVNMETGTLHHYRHRNVKTEVFVTDRSILTFQDAIVKELTALRKSLNLSVN